jgi:hypothetical protein
VDGLSKLRAHVLRKLDDLASETKDQIVQRRYRDLADYQFQCGRHAALEEAKALFEGVFKNLEGEDG